MREVVPGCAVSVLVRRGGDTARLVSVYLPPGEQDGVLDQLEAGIPVDGVALVLAGDVNAQGGRPPPPPPQGVAGRAWLGAR